MARIHNSKLYNVAVFACASLLIEGEVLTACTNFLVLSLSLTLQALTRNVFDQRSTSTAGI